jgi:hypothetical protein
MNERADGSQSLVECSVGDGFSIQNSQSWDESGDEASVRVTLTGHAYT